MSDQADFQGMPNVSTPLTNSDGTVNILWYRFFMSLMKKSGLFPNTIGVENVNRIGVQKSNGRVISHTLYGGGLNASVAYYTSGPPDYLINSLNIYDVTTGQFIGFINISTWLGP